MKITFVWESRKYWIICLWLNQVESQGKQNAFRGRHVHKTEGVIRPTSLASHSDCQTPLQLIVAANEHNVLRGYFVLYQPLCCAKSSFLLPSSSAVCVCGVHWRKTPPDCMLLLDVVLPDLRAFVLPLVLLSFNQLETTLKPTLPILVLFLHFASCIGRKFKKGGQSSHENMLIFYIPLSPLVF